MIDMRTKKKKALHDAATSRKAGDQIRFAPFISTIPQRVYHGERDPVNRGETR